MADHQDPQTETAITDAPEGEQATRGRDDSADGILGLPTQLVAAIRNAMDIARMGRLEETAKTPYEVVLREPTFVLRRYERDKSGAATVRKTRGRSAQAAAANEAATSPADARAAAATGHKRRPALVLVPPLMITAEVYDIAAEGSAVGNLLDHGVDPWVVDFGAPERQEGALERTLADHVLAVSKSVDYVREVTGADVHLAGYSQGGIFVYLAGAYRRSEGLASLITFGSPVNVHTQVLPGVPDEIAVPMVETLGSVMAMGFSRTAVPAWLTRNTFRLLSPTKEIQNQLEFLRSLSDRETLARKEGQRRFLGGEGFVAWPGPAFRDFVEQMIMGNRLFSGGFVVEGQTVTMADITCPVLAFVGTNDDIARAPTVRSVADAAPRAELWEASIPAGHMGLVVGSRALEQTWPTVAEWIFWREGEAARPELLEPLGAGAKKHTKKKKKAGAKARGTASARHDAEPEESRGGLLGMAGSMGRDALALLMEAASEGAEAVFNVGSNLTRQLPRLVRLETLRRDSRVGLALTLAEQAKDHPDNTFFLYEGRAHTFAAADARVDAIVRGLLQIGVRTGDHVGVLMHTRPTALATVAAINRLGAVSVLLRPEGDLDEELVAGQVEHLIADPDHAEPAVAAWDGTVYVLGGINVRAGALPEGAEDMESIDPARVAVPEWYAPSPGRSEDVAFVFFAGSGDGLRANRITNRRWALSAFGTASAAALTASDTVYSWTPIQHPTGLLVSMSGALAGGARLAMAQGFSARTFWEEVRRYGASVVFYAGTMLRALVDAPRDPAERKHPVRLFAGSGMPRPLWQRVVERFGPVNVLEFYATTEGNAILANVSGKKVGAHGRPLPGSSAIRLAAWNVEAGEPVYWASGYVRPAEVGEAGMLLSRVERDRGALESKPLRNVFERGDAWRVSGNLFRADADGDFWLVDAVADLIWGRSGVVASVAIEETVWELPFVSAAAAYGVTVRGVDHEIPTVAIVIRDGKELDTEALERTVVERLEAPSRPVLVRVVDALPMTAGYRVLKAPLRAEGLPKADIEAGRIYLWDPVDGRYEPMGTDGLRRLRRVLAAGK